MNKKVLITGGTGFIGRNVVNELIANGYEVHSLVYPPFAPEQNGLFQYEMNLMDTNAVTDFMKEHKFENLIHLAWYVGKGCQTSNTNISWVSASLNLLQQFKENGGKKILMTGSVSEYDYKNGYLTEDFSPLNNEYLYGKAKASLYVLAKEYAKLNNLDFKWARLFNVYGPNEREQRLMPSVILSMLKGEDVKVSTCTKYQDYLHVEDLARAIVMLFESKSQGAVNICSGKPVQLREIVNKIAEYTNFKGQILWGAIPTYFEESLVVGNNRRLEKEIHFKSKFSLDDGLRNTIEWWKENYKE